MEKEKIRIDRWLWAVRVFKTRSQATEACRKGNVFIENTPAKPSRIIRCGEVVVVKKSPVWYSLEVLEITGKRVSPAIALNLYRNLTPQEELNKLNVTKISGFEYRERGSGRPTKMERRSMDRLKKHGN